MQILAIEPYFGGSHRVFLEGVISNSRHDWSLASLPARHWKWRMRSAPAAIMKQVRTAVSADGDPDAVLVSDMLDLPSWIGFASRDSGFRPWVSTAPIAMYFHENQWAYPAAPNAREDHHFAFTNLTSASAADACWFNSEFNRSSFLDHSRAFMRRMPDGRDAIDVDAIERASGVFSPGFQPPLFTSRLRALGRPLRLGWVGRFEHDKRPDRFVSLLHQIAKLDVPFELILLGQRGRRCETLDELRSRFGDQILVDGYAESRHEYEDQLGEMDCVVSTADHEFFGIAMCEAIWAGAIPVAPNGLSYLEYVPDELRYDSVDQAAKLIQRLAAKTDLTRLSEDCRKRVAGYRVELAVERLDVALDQLAQRGNEKRSVR